MKITNDKTENSQMFLTIEMEPEEVEESMQVAFKRLNKKARIPGFRKGKAPRDIFERYLGKDYLMEEALNDIIPMAYAKAVEEQSIEAIAQPQIEIEQMEPLIMKATVPLKPTIELGDYKSLKVEQETVEITSEKVDEVIEQLRHQNATWEPVEGRAVEFDDLLIMDIVGTMGEKNVIEQKGAQYQVTAGQTFPVQGFAEQLVGMNSGDEKEFEMVYPEDYGDEELAGNKVNFKINAIEIKKEVLPEISDEFAKTVDAEFETMTALRERAETDMKERAEQQSKMNFEEEIVHGIADVSKVEYPPVLIESEITRILNQQFQRSNQSLEDYLATVSKTEEELREDLRPSAEHRVVHSLVLSKVAEVEEIEVSNEEVDEEIENMVKDSTDKKEELKKFFNDPQIRDSIVQNMMTRKTMEKLTEYTAAAKPAKKKKTTGTRKKKKEEEK
ncbi:trigger factor [Chloroflexota bacterium]